MKRGAGSGSERATDVDENPFSKHGPLARSVIKSPVRTVEGEKSDESTGQGWEMLSFLAPMWPPPGVWVRCGVLDGKRHVGYL